MENSGYFVNFLKVNNLTNAEISRYLEKSSQYIGQCVKGTSKLSWDSIQKLRDNPFGWQTDMLPETPLVQNNIKSSTNFNVNTNLGSQIDKAKDDLIRHLQEKCELLEKLLDDKERTIQILMNKN